MNPQKKGFFWKSPNCKVIEKIAERFMDYCDSYTRFFDVYRYNNVGVHAKNYLAGLLMKSPRKNMERINEYVCWFTGNRTFCPYVQHGNYSDYEYEYTEDGRKIRSVLIHSSTWKLFGFPLYRLFALTQVVISLNPFFNMEIIRIWLRAHGLS